MQKHRLLWLVVLSWMTWLAQPGHLMGQAPDVIAIQNTILTFSSTDDLLYLNGSLMNLQDVANNGNVRMQGNAQLILLGSLVNQASGMPVLTSGSAGVVRFMGSSPQLVDGVGLHRFHKLFLETGGSGQLQLNADIRVSDSLWFITGNLDLGSRGILLGNAGKFVGERDQSRAFSTGVGFVEARRFTTGASTDIAGIGAHLQSTFDTVVVRRYHNQYLNVADSSILRNVELTVRNGSGAAASMTLDYMDAELDGIAENNFVQFASPDQSTWTPLASTHQTSTNAVASTAIQAPANQAHRYTIASEDCATGPSVNLGPDRSICFGDTALLDAGNPGLSYRWSTGAATQTITVDSLGLDTAQIYWVEVINLRGCKTRDTIGIHGNYNLHANLGADRTECNGIPVTLNLGNGFGSYLWNSGATTQAITVNTPGTYWGTIQNTGVLQVDQSNLGTSSEAGAVTSVSQVYVPGGTGELSRILVGFGPSSSSGNLVLTVYADSTQARPIYSQAFPYAAGTTTAFNLSAPVRVKANRHYRFELSASTAFKPMVNNAYAAGSASLPNQDLQFATFIQYNSSCPSTDTVAVNFLPTPNAPSAPDTLRCGPGAVALTVVPGSGASTVRWYADSLTTTVLHTGTTFTTPVLNATTAYFVSSLTTGGCESQARDRVQVTIAPLPNLSSTTTPVACFGGNTGAVDLSVSSGTPTFAYSWSNGSTTQDLNAVAAGTFAVTLTDANGCTATHSATVSQPSSGISSTASVTHVSCNGQQDGAVDLTVSGGTSPYSYLWSNGATTQDLALLNPGTYTVTITDAHACTATRTATVNTPSAIALSHVAQNPSCAGQSTGSIDLTPAGGSGSYTYLWSNGATSQDLSGIGSGTYTVTVTDAGGCTGTTTVSITAPAPLNLSASAVNVLCNGGNSGAANLAITGGTPGYTYQWSNGATTQNITGLIAGAYLVTVTDQAGCAALASTTVAEPTAISLSVSTTQSTCGSANGTATASATGGAGTYTYFWPSNGATTPTATGLSAGNYTVIVTDINGCVDSSLAAVSDFGAPTVTLDSAVQVQCNGGADGELYVSTTGGAAPISYLWSNGATTEDLLGLPAGLYGLTVTDASSCVAALSVSLTEPSALALSLIGQDPACAGNPTGSIQAFVLGAVPPYTYAWSNGANTPVASGLLAGIYTLTVTDAAGCTTVQQDTLLDPPGMATSVIGTNPLCFGMSDGGADLTVTGGTPPYNYQWSMGQIGEDPIALGAGTYYVTVSDQGGCSRVDSVTLVAPDALAAAAVATDVTCFGLGDGTIDVGTTGGTLPYAYLWAAGDTTEDLSALTPGIYGLTVTDANGCAATLADSIQEPALLQLADSVVHIACGGGLSGELHLSAQGGTPAYAVLWSNGATALDLTGLAAGVYAATVTDANGCVAMITDTILEPAAIVISDTVQGVSCLGQSDGAIFLSVTGGVPAHTYQWSNGAQTPDVYGLPTGVYTVTVTDARGCAMVDSIEVEGGDSALQAVLLAATYVDAEDTLFLYELSQPTPTEIFWDFGDGDTSTARYPVHVYARNMNEDTSTYVVKLIVRNTWCVDSIEQTIYVNNDIQKTDGKPTVDPNAFFLSGTVLPNPNNGAFTIRLDLSHINDVQLDLFDVAGRKLIGRHLSGDSHYESSFQVTGAAQGVYLLRATSGRHSQVYRVVIL